MRKSTGKRWCAACLFVVALSAGAQEKEEPRAAYLEARLKEGRLLVCVAECGTACKQMGHFVCAIDACGVMDPKKNTLQHVECREICYGGIAPCEARCKTACRQLLDAFENTIVEPQP